MTPWLDDGDLRLYHGDALDTVRQLPDESVDCVVTSPPYWGLRDYGTGQWEGGDEVCDHRIDPRPFQHGQGRQGNAYGTPPGGNASRTATYSNACGKCGATRIDRQMGLEPTPDLFVANMVELFREIRRVLAPHGTCWVNLGSSYFSGQDRQPNHAPAYGNGDTAPLDSPGPDSACSGLCDEHLADYLNHRARTAGNDQPLSPAVPQHERTDRDTEPAGSGPASPVASPPDAQASTTLQSWLQLRGECSRCDKRSSSLSGVRSSASGVPASAHNSWLNYTRSLKPKDMVPTPWMLAMALQQDGWYLRADIIWSKPNPMPESVTDRPTKAHEYVFLLTKQPRYWFDAEAVREPHAYDWTANAAAMHKQNKERRARVDEANGGILGAGGRDSQYANGPNPAGRNVRSVWQIATQPYPEAHFATYPEELARRCILAGCPERVCLVCGKPSERIVDTSYDAEGRTTNGPRSLEQRHETAGFSQRLVKSTSTLGWSDCECRTVHQTDVTRVVMANQDKWRPGVVLDPFIGSGTTAKVARDHQRHAIGIDISLPYLELAARRLQQLSLLT